MTHAKDEALQMCLEYIETDAHERKYVRHAIKQALAAQHEPENEPFVSLASVQEPVAWRKFNGFRFDYIEHQPALSGMVSKEWKPLYDTTPPAQPAVPEGWKLVPVEPTKEMAIAYWQFNDRQDVRMIDAWKAILEAAPEKGNT
jgi:hypothetical protein